MIRPARRFWVMLILGPAALFTALWLFSPGANLVSVTQLPDGPVLASFVLDHDQRFTLYYHHSVNGLPIWEVHRVGKDGRIFIMEERFKSFNAGMGHWRGHGRHILKNGLQAIVGIDMPTGDFVLRVGAKGVNHIVIWPGGRVNLTSRAQGKPVQFSAAPIGGLKALWLRLTG